MNLIKYIPSDRHGVKPFQKGLSPSPFSKPFLKKGLSPDLSLLGLKKGLKKGLSPSPDLSPFIKGGLKSGFKPSQKRA